jgi:orotate phosphoribosyltransferase
MDLITSFIRLKLESFKKLDGIAGGAVAGVPFASCLAKSLGTKLIVVRKEAKGHGIIGNAVEGMEQGDKVILVEDIITNGGSKKNFIRHLQKYGEVKAVVVVFDREQGGKELLLEEFKIPLVSLVGIKRHLEIGLENKFISQEAYNILMVYLTDPKGWSDKQRM